MSRLVRLFSAAAAAGVAETALCLVRAPPRVTTAGTWLGAVAVTWLFGFAAASVVHAAARCGVLAGYPRFARRAGVEGLVVAIFLLPLVLGVSTLAGRFFVNAFSNVELSALLSGAVTLLAVAFAWLSFMPLHALLRRAGAGASPRARALTFGALGLYLVLFVLGSTRSLGLGQLDPGLALTVVAAVLGFLASRWLPPVRPAWLALLALALFAVAVWTRNAEPPAFSLFARHGSWSKAAVFRARLLVDRDGDGFSAWFAGGDCNDDDPTVSPGAREVARDGLDNDCVGGDATEARSAETARLREANIADGARANLVLVTIETLRADRLSLLGYARPTTPRLEALASSSVVFERVYAAAPGTRLSLAALLSGRTPSSLSWVVQPPSRQTRRIAPENPWLPALLAENGYRTLAVQTNFRAFTAAENAGFDRGFDVYDSTTELAFVGGTFRGFPGGAQIDRALALIDASRERPFALWVHLVEPHYLYEQSPHVPSFGHDALALYDAEIAEADRQVGRLVDGLSARSLLEQTVLVVCGDHGEEFGEHGQRYHATNLYDAQVRTALLMRLPGVAPGRVREPVALTDVTPTLVDWLRLPSSGVGFDGRNLLPRLLRGEALRPGFFLENFRPESGASLVTALVEWPFKLLYDQEGRTYELYELERDPLERENLYGSSHPAERALVDRLRARLRSAASISPSRSP